MAGLIKETKIEDLEKINHTRVLHEQRADLEKRGVTCGPHYVYHLPEDLLMFAKKQEIVYECIEIRPPATNSLRSKAIPLLSLEDDSSPPSCPHEKGHGEVSLPGASAMEPEEPTTGALMSLADVPSQPSSSHDENAISEQEHVVDPGSESVKQQEQEQEQSVSKPKKPIGGAIQLFKLDLQAHPTEKYTAAVKGLPLLQRNAVMAQMWEDAADDVKEKFKIAWCSKLQQYKADLSAYEGAIKDMPEESEKDSPALPPKPKMPVGGAKKLFKFSVRAHPPDEYTARLKGLSALRCNPVLTEMWEQAPIEVKQRSEASFRAKLAAYHADKSVYDAAEYKSQPCQMRLQSR